MNEHYKTNLISAETILQLNDNQNKTNTCYDFCYYRPMSRFERICGIRSEKEAEIVYGSLEMYFLYPYHKMETTSSSGNYYMGCTFCSHL